MKSTHSSSFRGGGIRLTKEGVEDSLLGCLEVEPSNIVGPTATLTVPCATSVNGAPT